MHGLMNLASIFAQIPQIYGKINLHVYRRKKKIEFKSQSISQFVNQPGLSSHTWCVKMKLHPHLDMSRPILVGHSPQEYEKSAKN